MALIQIIGDQLELDQTLGENFVAQLLIEIAKLVNYKFLHPNLSRYETAAEKSEGKGGTEERTFDEYINPWGRIHFGFSTCKYDKSPIL